MADTLWMRYKAWADETETRLLDWSDPSGTYKLSPMQEYPLADFATVFLLCIGYLVFVVVGTLVMKSNAIPAINTSALQFVYNPLQIVLCSYMFIETLLQAYRFDYSLTPCNAFNAKQPVMGQLMYFFYLSKLLDWCDTFFIIVGKKWKQLSVLHVYHHVSVFFIYNHLFRTSYDGDLFMTIILNGFVHTVMYLYYFVSSHTRDIWWKKYLTMLQMIQFLLMNLQGYLMVSRQCETLPYKIPRMYLAYVQSLFWLFVNFYVRNYYLTRKAKSTKTTKTAKLEMPLPLRQETRANLDKLADKYGTPLQIYDEQLIRENARNLLTTFRRYFPDFQQFYAVKALPNPAILRILRDEGCGMDCSSSAELFIVDQIGVPGNEVMFTSNFTSQKDLATAFDQNVIVNLDDASLVDSLVAVRGRCPELISFRLNPGLGRTDSETKSNVLGGPDAKFGVPPFQIVEAYRKAKEAGASRFGIHMMTGSCVMDQAYWKETVTVLFDTIMKLRNELGIEFEFMNIGGGLGIPYYPDQEPVDVEAIAKMLREIFDDAMKAYGLQTIPRLCMENGRYMTGPFGWLITRCEAIKQSYGRYYGVDACMAHLMRPGMYGAYHHITVPARETSTDREESHVVGTLCENNDWFAKDRLLPRAQVGDLFVIHDTGAHSHSMGFQYNGKLRAPEVLIRPNGDDALIRKRETLDDLFGNCVTPAESVRHEKRPSGAVLDYVVCLRLNAAFSCKNADMVECLSETERLHAGVVVVLACILFICCTRRKAKARLRDREAQAQIHSGRNGDGMWTDAGRSPAVRADKLKTKMMTGYPPVTSSSVSSNATTAPSQASTVQPARGHASNTKAGRRPQQWSDRASELSPSASKDGLMKLTESVIDLHDAEADDYFIDRSRPPRGGYSSSIASDTSSMLSISSFSALNLSRPDGASDSISSWDSRVPSECALSFTIDEEEEELERARSKQKKTKSFKAKRTKSRTRQEIEF
ncbi:hypothetical protein P43SY_005205 [Pythium insidiosum]|uniref:Orn/DAP/Arg decarboxylase 2 N-terminal domain-containing protein n=1 Tax=Pythium insidiosum TaxID=114742 RepID=A0AAD5Q9L5_PYTIN|nr:hypothetical protein P43SY_005205 [Pythium insidiosum]